MRLHQTIEEYRVKTFVKQRSSSSPLSWRLLLFFYTLIKCQGGVRDTSSLQKQRLLGKAAQGRDHIKISATSTQQVFGCPSVVGFVLRH